MKFTVELEPEQIERIQADNRGRVTLGSEYAGKEVRIAVLEVFEEPTAPTGASEDLRETVDAAIGELEPPGTSEQLQERRREALREALDELLKHGELSKSELLEAVSDTAGYSDRQSLWRNWLYEGLHELAEEDVVESPGSTSRGWRLQDG